ncbi:MAG: hypothetical protein ACE5JK_01155 [Candidatus Omnitrophota bacterium]
MYCQNFKFGQEGAGEEVSPRELGMENGWVQKMQEKFDFQFAGENFSQSL